MPYIVGIAAVFILWFIYGISTQWNPLKLVEGADYRLSTSKFQFWLWTLVIIFAYSAIAYIRLLQGWPTHFNLGISIPRALLIAMGFSVSTTTVAKGVTVNYINTGRLSKSSAAPGSRKISDIFLDDSGSPDLSKTQMIAWTCLAIIIYLVQVAGHIHGHKAEMPDIDPTLVALMGLGQTAYLGKKLVADDTARLTSLSPQKSTGLPQTVTVTGTSFGQTPGTISLNETPMPGITIVSWSDTQIQFSFPALNAAGVAWQAGETVQVGVVVAGQKSANKISFVI